MPKLNHILQNPDAERAVIGTLLADSQCWAQVDFLVAEYFSVPYLRAIWTLIDEKRGQVTIEEVVTRLAAQASDQGSLLQDAGGTSGVEALKESARSLQDAEQLAHVIQDCAVSRATKNILESTLRTFLPGEDLIEPADRIDTLVKDLSSIAVGIRMDTSELAEGADDWDREFAWLLANPGKMTGMRTFFRDIDDHMIQGLDPGNFWVIASNTGEGKSIFVAQIAAQLALKTQDNGKNVRTAIFGVEMSGKEIFGRFIQQFSRVDGDRLRHPERLTPAEIAQVRVAQALIKDKVVPHLFYMGPDKFGSIDDIVRQCRYLAKEKQIGCIVIDYIQRIVSSRGRDKRTEEIGDITSRLKRLAAELKLPIIAVSQITRQASKDQSGRATLHDLADSASVERDADYVTSLWRPSIHLEGKAQQKFDNVSVLELLKGRFRAHSLVFLRFDGSISRFDDLATAKINQLKADVAAGALKTQPPRKSSKDQS